jgi:hypothetical protein
MEDALQKRGMVMVFEGGGPSGHQSTQSVSHEDAGPDSFQWATQTVLAAMITAPDRQLMGLIQEKFPGRKLGFYATVLGSAKDLIEQLTGGPIHKSTEVDSSPTIVDRLSFAWRFLYKGDVLLRKLKQAEIPKHSGIQLAEAAFQNILPVPIRETLLLTLLEWLRLGPGAEYLVHYWSFRRSKRPSKLPSPFGEVAKTGDRNLLRTIIWWCLRSRREEYVEVRLNEPVRIEFAFVVKQVLQDLNGWCGPEIETVSDLAGEVERQLNWWLTYSRLELPLEGSGPDSAIDPEIARAYVKHNELTTKLHIHRADSGPEPDERVRQLEAMIRQYAEENRALEDRIRLLEASPVTSPPAIEPETQLTAFVELREVLKTIDTKYAFDTLSAVQSGEDTHLTLRSFVSHLFYALRKRGLSEYPKEDQFTLTYEASGLYDCDGFEVPPAGSVQVKVIRRGWALNARGRWLPIRRARVTAVER